MCILILILLILIIPIKIKIDYHVISDNKSEKIKISDTIKIYILGFLKVKTFYLHKKKNYEKNNILENILNISDFLLKMIKQNQAILTSSELKKINENIYFKNFNLNLGFTTQNVILNSYIVAILNSAINIYILNNDKNIDQKNFKYYTYISNELVNIDLDCILFFNLVNTIYIIIKAIIRFKKVVDKNGRTTSNRKLNANCNDIN